MKVCAKCKLFKNLCDFNKKSNNKDGLRTRCRSCQSEDQYQYASKIRDKLREKHKIYRQKNPDKIIETRHKHFSNPQKQEKRKKRENEYIKKRRKTDPLVALKLRIRNRTRKVFKDKLGRKYSESISSLLGCTPAFFKSYFESLFSENMTWDDVYSGKIHIDHIIPISSATTEEELKKLSHYTNLQPLWAVDNLKKSDKFL